MLCVSFVDYGPLKTFLQVFNDENINVHDFVFNAQKTPRLLHLNAS